MTNSNMPSTEVNQQLAAQIQGAKNEIALAKQRQDPAALKEIHDKASALEKLVGEIAKKNKSLGANLKKLNELARIRITAAREMGSILREMVRRGGPRYRGRTLDEFNISRNQSAKWQKLADLPDMLDAYIETANVRTEEASVAGYMRFTRNDPHFSSESNEWYTPQNIIDAAAQVLDGIAVDPCSNTGTPNVPASKHYTAEDDGLSMNWNGTVYMNPPYGRALKHWVRKFKLEHGKGRMTAGIALLPARPGSDWFDEISEYDVSFIRGRLRFSEGNPAPFPSMCVYCGPDAARFLQVFSPIGCMYRPLALSKDETTSSE